LLYRIPEEELPTQDREEKEEEKEQEEEP